MKQSLLTVLVNPAAFFDNAAHEPENLRIPALIVLAGAIVAAAHGYLLAGPTAQMMSQAMPIAGTIVVLTAVIAPVIITFIFWLIWTAIIFGISSAFKGKGTFKRLMEFVGYGYIPQIIGTLLTLIISLLYIPQVAVPSLSPADLQNPQAIQAAANALAHDPAMVAFTQIAIVISIVFLLWSANIWIFAAKSARQVPLRDSLISVMVPVLAIVVYSLYSVVML